MTQHLLVISPTLTRETLSGEPFRLDLDAFYLCTPPALRFISLRRFQAVVLHEVPEDVLTKVALGIRDDEASEGLWEILQDSHRPVFLLTAVPTRPTENWRNLGIEPILAAELSARLREHSPLPVGGRTTDQQTILTADDIHTRHRRGETVIAATARLTPWAREVADSLGMTVQEAGGDRWLVDLPITNRAQLQADSEAIFAWHSRFPDLLFVVPPLYFPVFSEMFPSLRGRLVSPTVHWERRGAFTGEVSVEMLADAGCVGALLPTAALYANPKHLEKLTISAHQHGLSLFRRIPLEPGNEYDIMATPYGFPQGIPLAISAPGSGSEKTRETVARLLSRKDLEAIVAGKGIEK